MGLFAYVMTITCFQCLGSTNSWTWHQTPMAKATDYHCQGRTPTVSAGASLVDDLNSFYARFEASNNTISGTIAVVSSIARDEHTLSVTEHDVRRGQMRVITRKAAGPDGI